jgi:sterol desaturase/sphingolipid hydroxylase (fatty acid hydroxylase superfamily)
MNDQPFAPTCLVEVSAQPTSPAHSRFKLLVSWGLYPLLVGGALAVYLLAKSNDWALSQAFMAYAAARLVLLLICEFALPAKREWGMTRASFFRDLKFAVVNGIAFKLIGTLVTALAIDASQFNLGLVHGAPVWAEVLALVLCFEFFQYWMHRFSHEERGAVGRFLWRVHAAHHLPSGVYLFMHAVGHPLNLVWVMLVNAPLVLLGASSEAMFFFGALMGLQGLVSHLNVGVRAGPLNYLLVGTELHRYHHSADLREAGNYGAITPFWDLVFGTFVYRPGQLPERIGVANPEQYPHSTEVLKVIGLPIRRR